MIEYTHGEYEVSAGQERYYTPTIEEQIRTQFTFGFAGDARTRQSELCSRLLAEVKAQERKIERERIIKLIKENGVLRWESWSKKTVAVLDEDIISIIRGKDLDDDSIA